MSGIPGSCMQPMCAGCCGPQVRGGLEHKGREADKLESRILAIVVVALLSFVIVCCATASPQAK